MAEKEQRIWLEFDIPKPKGAVEATRCTTMTRSEAIERMAKAIFLEIYPGEETDIVNACSDYKNMAKSALNALLEGK